MRELDPPCEDRGEDPEILVGDHPRDSQEITRERGMG
jgi:hypothetical protein